MISIEDHPTVNDPALRTLFPATRSQDVCLFRGESRPRRVLVDHFESVVLRILRIFRAGNYLYISQEEPLLSITNFECEQFSACSALSVRGIISIWSRVVTFVDQADDSVGYPFGAASKGPQKGVIRLLDGSKHP
jgi:hypothetical protein